MRTNTTTNSRDRVAVPRTLVLDAVKALDYAEGGGPIIASRLREFATTPARREVPLSPRQRWSELIKFARAVAGEEIAEPLVIDAVLASWAPDADRDAFDDLVDAVSVRDRLETGELSWRYQYPEIRATIAPEEIAIQQATEVMHSEAWALVWPTRKPCNSCRRRAETEDFPNPVVDGQDVCGPCLVRREIAATRAAADSNVVPLGRPA